MKLNSQHSVPPGYSVLGMRSGQVSFHAVANPLIYSVIGTPRQEGGFLAEWWVTGPKGPDSRLDPLKDRPVLLLNMITAINCTKEEFESRVQEMWDQGLEDFAFASALSGGIVDTLVWKRLSERTQSDLVINHLMGHDYLGHFSKANKTVRAAMMYQLLHDMGVTKIQQALAKFEGFAIVGLELRMSESPVPTATINQRLTHAKKLGLLSSAAAGSGRRPQVASQSKIQRDSDSALGDQEFQLKPITPSTPPHLERFASDTTTSKERDGAEQENEEE
jgi:hypothetical protein